mmetsp:Transcript_36122/g.95941  ORF Transcript_36122/g.95941 Transcript_36122/m.95941 type:complete len:245 (-) Transcript_36122:7-741(-)
MVPSHASQDKKCAADGGNASAIAFVSKPKFSKSSFSSQNEVRNTSPVRAESPTISSNHKPFSSGSRVDGFRERRHLPVSFTHRPTQRVLRGSWSILTCAFFKYWDCTISNSAVVVLISRDDMLTFTHKRSSVRSPSNAVPFISSLSGRATFSPSSPTKSKINVIDALARRGPRTRRSASDFLIIFLRSAIFVLLEKSVGSIMISPERSCTCTLASNWRALLGGALSDVSPMAMTSEFLKPIVLT